MAPAIDSKHRKMNRDYQGHYDRHYSIGWQPACLQQCAGYTKHGSAEEIKSDYVVQFLKKRLKRLDYETFDHTR